MMAAIRACEMIIAKFTRLADETVGQVSIKYSQIAKSYITMQTMLQARLAMEEAVPYAGGISRSDKMVNELDADLVKPEFRKHMMENHLVSPWTGLPYAVWLEEPFD
jgi:hypothetical protein